MGATAHTLSLFDRVVPPAWPRLAPEVPSGSSNGDPDGLRPYQRTAVTRIGEELARVRSTLLVMATGTGKTQTFGAVAKHWGGRVLVLAHRDELIQQARGRMAEMTQEWVGVEKAEWSAQAERIVVGSVQTLCRESRLSRFARDRFALVVVDEAHHAVAPTYKRILEHFEAAKVLGVTATPDRGDEMAMEQVFESVAFRYDILDGIEAGFLCPVRRLAVNVGAIDLSGVKTTAGDLDQRQLDAVMSSEEVLHGVAKPLLELAGERRTIVFTTGVDNAHRMAEVLNRYRGGCARAVDGTTAADTRRDILRGHKAGEYQYLVNVGVLTEGYDDPGVACVAMERPTKSRALYAQCVGRGLRPHPGKQDCLVLDFVGNNGRHKLVCALDILGGKWPEDVIAKAKERNADVTSDEAFREAADEIASAKAAEKQRAIAARISIKAKRVDYHALEVDPFGAASALKWSRDKRSASPAQVDALHKWRIDVPDGCTTVQASRLLSQAVTRKKKSLSSYGQIRNLSRYGVDGRGMYESTAFEVLRAIDRNGGIAISPEQIAAIAASREPGSDG